MKSCRKYARMLMDFERNDLNETATIIGNPICFFILPGICPKTRKMDVILPIPISQLKMFLILGLIYSNDLNLSQHFLPHLQIFRHPFEPNTFFGQNGTLVSLVNISEQKVFGHFLIT